MSCPRAAGNSNKGARSARIRIKIKDGHLNHWFPVGGAEGVKPPRKLIHDSINCLKYNIK
jgi:hypothetical protein